MIETKNKIFFLIPALNETDAGEDVAYLKVLKTATEEDVIDVFRSIVDANKLISQEEVECFYDKSHFDTLYKMVKTQARGNDKRKPSEIAPLLTFLDDFTKVPDAKVGNVPLTVNGKVVNKGLINAYIEYSVDNVVVLANNESLEHPDNPIKVSSDVDNPKRNYSEIEVLPCNKDALYIWLCQNRNPKRKYDVGYDKHSNKVKRGKKGRTVSAMNYSDNEAEQLLQWAVKTSKGNSSEAYLLDTANKKLIVFYDEGLKTPSFHGHEIDKKDKANWESAWKRVRERGKRTRLEKRITESAKIIEKKRNLILNS